jgi:selenocysteine-specific elongation factor
VPPLLGPALAIRDGQIVLAAAPDALASAVRSALTTLERQFATRDFAVPTEAELTALGLTAPHLAAAVRAKRLIRLAPDLVLLPQTVHTGLRVLAGLPQPFTAGQAREALGTSRKVVMPLLEYLAAHGHTRRVDDGHHVVTGR